jgi:hypothetical protein
MKKWILIGLTMMLALLTGTAKQSGETPRQAPTTPALLTESRAADAESRLGELSSELKSRTCVLPRRTVLSTVHAVSRTLPGDEKTARQIRLRHDESLRRAGETVTDRRSAFYLALLCRRGYYIYVLRKLLI